MVNGKPYISANSATINAENAPKDFQSRKVFGLEKLNAKMIKTSELIITKLHNP
jgi:hypothetical protein